MNDLRSIPTALACLADPSRYRVVSVLVEGDYCVTEIATRVGLSQSCTTRHLQALQRAGVLTRTRVGKRVLFRIRDDDPELGRLLEIIVLRRPLAAPPRRQNTPAAGDDGRVDSEWVPIAHRQLTAQTGGPAPDAVTIPIRANREAIVDTPGEAESPHGPEPEAASVPEVAASISAGEIEDYLL